MTDNSTPQLPPAGWYPDQQNAGAQRYWDGTAWTEHTVVPVADSPTVPAADAAANTPNGVSPGGEVALPQRSAGPRLKWWHWALIGLGVLVLVSIIVNGVNRTGTDNASADKPTTVAEQAAEQPVVEEEPEVTMVAVPDVVGATVGDARAQLEALGITLVTDAADNWVITEQRPSAGEYPEEDLPEFSFTAEPSHPSLAHENAVAEAQSYLSVMPFSRAGLFEQMTSEYGAQYPADQAEYAIGFLEQNGLVDWNAEAVEAAQSYLDTMSFSRAGLFDQMTSQYGSQFTPEQANYALDTVGLH